MHRGCRLSLRRLYIDRGKRSSCLGFIEKTTNPRSTKISTTRPVGSFERYCQCLNRCTGSSIELLNQALQPITAVVGCCEIDDFADLVHDTRPAFFVPQSTPTYKRICCMRHLIRLESARAAMANVAPVLVLAQTLHGTFNHATRRRAAP
jgi:hypothetical protein